MEGDEAIGPSGAQEPIHAAGARINAERLQQILKGALSDADRDGVLVLRDANFEGATFQGDARLDGATFNGFAGFMLEPTRSYCVACTRQIGPWRLVPTTIR